jgi:hypothetical protein
MTTCDPVEAWAERIVNLSLIQQHIRDLDTEGRYRYHLPRIPASEGEIAAVEGRVGHRLDAQYKEFLKHGNGWPGVLQWTDLFGTQDLMNPKLMGSARAELEALEGRGELKGLGLVAGELLPIGLTSPNFDPPPRGVRDVFAIGKPSSAKAGHVFWLAGELVDQFPDFSEFFLAMLDYNREVFQDLADEIKPA